jgi:hypothetical protein
MVLIKRSLLLGTTRHLLVGKKNGDRKFIDREAHKLLMQGAVESMPDGSTRWYDHAEILNLKAEGSARYQWDRSGNRVLHRRYMVTKKTNGEVARISIGTAYLAPN